MPAPTPTVYPAVDFDRPVHAILGLPIDAIDEATTSQALCHAAMHGRQVLLSTPNLNFAITCLDDAEFRASVLQSDLSVADGTPLVWVARLLGAAVPARVAGSSLFQRLAAQATHRFSVFFFGGDPGAGDAAMARLNRDGAAGMRAVGALAPGFGSVDEMSSDATLARINSSGADFLVLAIGARKGQAWLLRNRARLDAPVLAYLGAVINFTAGTVRRAPRWMQRSGLEWAWRVLQERTLARRYWSDGWRLAGLLLGRVLPGVWRMRLGRPQDAAFDAAQAAETVGEDGVCIALAGPWGQPNVARLRTAFSEAAAKAGGIRVDLSAVPYLDTAAIGLLMLLAGACQRAGQRLEIVGATPPTLRCFEACCAEYLLVPA